MGRKIHLNLFDVLAIGHEAPPFGWVEEKLYLLQKIVSIHGG
jgi:hypothetical protein